MMTIKTPPGFCENAPLLLREIKVLCCDDTVETMIIPIGMGVAEECHEFYWAEFETYTGMIAAGAKFCVFAALDKDNKPISVGAIDETDGPHEMAWLSCMLVERGACRVAWQQPEDLSPEVTDAIAAVPGVSRVAHA